MEYDDFVCSLDLSEPPSGASTALLALWHDARGNWEQAHGCVQNCSDPQSAWVHAYLHRKEGDLGNATYWYEKAERAHPGCSITEEWELITIAILYSTRS